MAIATKADQPRSVVETNVIPGTDETFLLFSGTNCKINHRR